MATADDPTGEQPYTQPMAPYPPPQAEYAPQVPQPGQAQYPPAQYPPQAQYPQAQYPQASYQSQQPGYGYLPPPAGMAPQQYAPPMAYGRPAGPVGTIRSTWAVLGLSLITLGIYTLYYYFASYEEMKKHSGEGVGGLIGLLLAIFTLGLVNPFVFPNEIGNLYARRGQARPVSATTGLWYLLGSVILIGPLVWLIKTNGALNAYWRSVGAG